MNEQKAIMSIAEHMTHLTELLSEANSAFSRIKFVDLISLRKFVKTGFNYKIWTGTRLIQKRIQNLYAI